MNILSEKVCFFFTQQVKGNSINNCDSFKTIIYGTEAAFVTDTFSEYSNLI